MWPLCQGPRLVAASGVDERTSVRRCAGREDGGLPWGPPLAFLGGGGAQSIAEGAFPGVSCALTMRDVCGEVVEGRPVRAQHASVSWVLC